MQKGRIRDASGAGCGQPTTHLAQAATARSSLRTGRFVYAAAASCPPCLHGSTSTRCLRPSFPHSKSQTHMDFSAAAGRGEPARSGWTSSLRSTSLLRLRRGRHHPRPDTSRPRHLPRRLRPPVPRLSLPGPSPLPALHLHHRLHPPPPPRAPPEPPLHAPPPCPLPGQPLPPPRPSPPPLLHPDPPPPSPNPVLLLFPSPAASDLASWCRSTPPSASANPILLLLDGTWKQAKEMYTASLPFLSSFSVPVSLPVDGGVDGDSMFESELVVKEPHKGCMSTMEAVARALRLLEPEGRGTEIEETMVGVLRSMVAFQAEHLQHRAMKPRLKMRKKDIKRKAGMV